MTHMKTLASPRALKIPKKERTWTMKSAPGAHKADESIAVGILLRDYLGIADNRKEVRYMLQNKALTVDGKVVKDEKLPLGLLDIVSIEGMDKYFIIMVDNNARLYPQEIDKKKTGEKLSKLTGKTMLKGGKFQLNLYDNKNILVSAKDSKKYIVGGTVILSLPDQKITGFIERAKDKTALIAKGRHAGKVGKILEITASGLNLKSLTTVDSDGEKFMTNTDYIFIVGDKESRI